MYGVYGDIISAAEKAIVSFPETEELLEYPEVQADKAYYLSVLSKYNELKAVKDKLDELKAALNEQNELSALLTESTSEKDREDIYNEISALKRKSSDLSVAVANLIGCKHATERAYCRFKLSANSALMGIHLSSMLTDYLRSRGGKIEDEQLVHKGKGDEISFIAEGEDIFAVLLPLTGAHKVVKGQKSEELCFAATPIEDIADPSEDELKITFFHSSGAGGQHINKTESAVRVTHIPTGLTVICQDERSQLTNKKRALDTIKKRLHDMRERTEKSRMEADIYAQYRKKPTPISFDISGPATMTDTRLKSYTDIPLLSADFASYMTALRALCR